MQVGPEELRARMESRSSEELRRIAESGDYTFEARNAAQLLLATRPADYDERNAVPAQAALPRGYFRGLPKGLIAALAMSAFYAVFGIIGAFIAFAFDELAIAGLAIGVSVAATIIAVGILRERVWVQTALIGIVAAYGINALIEPVFDLDVQTLVAVLVGIGLLLWKLTRGSVGEHYRSLRRAA